MVWLYVVLGIILLIILLLCLPVYFYLEIGESVSASVRYLLWRYKLLPREPVKKAEKAAETDAESAAEKGTDFFKKLHQEEGLGGAVSEICRIIGEAAKKFSALCRHIIVDKFFLFITIGGDDPAMTGITYGIVCSAVYPLRGMLSNLLKFRENKVKMAADFSGQPDSVNMNLKLHIRPIFILTSVVSFGAGIIIYKLRHRTIKKQAKEGAVK